MAKEAFVKQICATKASREKAVGIYAAGPLLQLPVPGARFCCNSIPHDRVDMFNKILTPLFIAHHFCALGTEIMRLVHPINNDSVVRSSMF
ncbi:hypothetical protein [Bradyrhizobium sp. USDA 4486]